MKITDSARDFGPDNLVQAEKWIYELASRLKHSKHRDDYIVLLSDAAVASENQEGKRANATRLLGALGTQTDRLIQVLTQDKSLWVRQSASDALVEIGEAAGEELLCCLLKESSAEKATILLKTLRDIMDCLRTSTEFRWLCYCVGRDIVYGDPLPHNHEAARVHAAKIMGYFTDTDDLSRLKQAEIPLPLQQRLMIAIRSSPRPPCMETWPLEKNRDWIDRLTGYFCLQDIDLAGQLRQFEQGPWRLSRRGLYALCQAVGVLHRSPNRELDQDTLEKLLMTIHTSELGSSDGLQNAGSSQGAYLKLVAHVLGRRSLLSSSWPELSSLNEWHQWTVQVWQEARQLKDIVFAPLMQPQDPITFKKLD